MSVTRAYRANYEVIARDHVRHWRETGRNPFQDRKVLRANEQNTVALVHRYVPKGSSVLDAGCGMGDLLLRLKQYECVGVEIAKPYLDVLRERELRHEEALIEKLPWPRATFDAVVATDVLEHVLDIHEATKELLRVLVPGGHIIVRVPNAEPVSWEEIHGYRFIHLRILDEGTMRLLFDRIFGCEVLETLIAYNSLHVVARK